ELLHGDRQARGQALHDHHQGATVGLAGGQVAQHALHRRWRPDLLLGLCLDAEVTFPLVSRPNRPIRSPVTYQCEECGKSLATEGGLAIHMDGHRPAPAPLTLATIPEPVGPVTPFELPEITPDPASHKSSRDELLVMGLAVATALIFLVGLIAAVHPSLIRDKRMSTVAASKSHGVAIPDASSSHAASPVSAPPATTPATTTPPSAADDVKVKSLVLQLADYGPGWKVDATSGGSSSSDSSSGGNI